MEKISKEIIGNLDEKQIIGRGNNANCFLIDEDNIVLVYNKINGSIDSVFRLYDNLIERTAILAKQGVNIGQVKDYKYEDGKLYVLQKRVKAKDLYSNNRQNTNVNMLNYRNGNDSINILVKAPQEHYDKYISDLTKILFEQGLYIDHRYPDNLMYNEDNGFYFIDLSVRQYNIENSINDNFTVPDIIALIINNITNNSLYKTQYRTEEEKNMLLIIYEKIFKAIVKYAKQDDKKRIETKTLSEILERFQNIKTKNIIEEIESLESYEKQLSNLENKKEIRKKLLVYIRLRRIYQLSDYKIEFLVMNTNSNLPIECMGANLNWSEEINKLEELDNETLIYLNDRDETKELALRQKCTQLGLNFEEHIKETTEASNKTGEEALLAKEIYYKLKSIKQRKFI